MKRTGIRVKTDPRFRPIIAEMEKFRPKPNASLESLNLVKQNQGDQKIGGKFAQFFDKVAKTVAKPNKCQNIFFKAKFESKDLHQTFLNS
jgi:hypothetical protein